MLAGDIGAADGSLGLEVWPDGSADNLVKTLSGYSIEGLETRQQSLEGMFMSYYKEGRAEGAALSL